MNGKKPASYDNKNQAWNIYIVWIRPWSGQEKGPRASASVEWHWHMDPGTLSPKKGQIKLVGDWWALGYSLHSYIITLHSEHQKPVCLMPLGYRKSLWYNPMPAFHGWHSGTRGQGVPQVRLPPIWSAYFEPCIITKQKVWDQQRGDKGQFFTSQVYVSIA